MINDAFAELWLSRFPLVPNRRVASCASPRTALPDEGMMEQVIAQRSNEALAVRPAEFLSPKTLLMAT
jgi:hypothetical protein